MRFYNTATYISFSDEKCEGRNSGIQSVPTAFNRFFSNAHEDKELFFYFLPCNGNNVTPYYLFMYRLMKTAGFNFSNVPPSLAGQITPFTSIDDIIRARKENGDRNSGNNATYIIKNAPHEYEIFGKTYGIIIPRRGIRSGIITYLNNRQANLKNLTSPLPFLGYRLDRHQVNAIRRN